MGDHQGAIADYSKAIEINPHAAHAYYGRRVARHNLSKSKTGTHRLSTQRRKKLDAIRQAGQAYPNDFRRSDLAADLHHQCQGKDREQLQREAPQATVAGRMLAIRLMGKAAFVNLRDMSGDIQLYIRQDVVGDALYQAFKQWGRGDIVGAHGAVIRMKSGELSIRVERLQHLVKCLQPMPEKYHGLSKIEERYQHRHLDLMLNPSVRETFVRRSKIISSIRQFFDERGFLEVETPMMHAVASGAAAQPFTTYHDALDMLLHLRIAPELYLKRLVVGGFEKVYELNRNFRNEGISARHNPEFTMLEFYQAYSDYHDLMDLTEALLQQLARPMCTDGVLTYGKHTINMQQPFARRTLAALVQHHHPELFQGDEFLHHKLPEYARSHHIKLSATELDNVQLAQFALFEKTIESQIIEPTFVTDYPKVVSPLAKSHPDNDDLVERFELFIGGYELANGFSELNDPADQEERMQEQQLANEQGNKESMSYDADYIRALEYGLPPTAGAGIGIDRLVMLLSNSASIRDVILFPLLRQSGKQRDK